MRVRVLCVYTRARVLYRMCVPFNINYKWSIPYSFARVYRVSIDHNNKYVNDYIYSYIYLN